MSRMLRMIRRAESALAYARKAGRGVCAQNRSWRVRTMACGADVVPAHMTVCAVRMRIDRYSACDAHSFAGCAQNGESLRKGIAHWLVRLMTACSEQRMS